MIKELTKGAPMLANTDAMRCECPHEGGGPTALSWLYDPVTELPFVDHRPGECRCVNELAEYRRGDRVLLLCSNCRLPGDERVGS